MTAHKEAATSKKTSKGSSSRSKLHPPEVVLIRHQQVMGWSDYQIWKEYCVPIPVIQKAKNEIERQATEEFENEELHVVELAKWKDRLKLIIDSMDLIAKDKNVSYADRIKFESFKLEALVILQMQ